MLMLVRIQSSIHRERNGRGWRGSGGHETGKTNELQDIQHLDNSFIEFIASCETDQDYILRRLSTENYRRCCRSRNKAKNQAIAITVDVIVVKLRSCKNKTVLRRKNTNTSD